MQACRSKITLSDAPSFLFEGRGDLQFYRVTHHRQRVVDPEVGPLDGRAPFEADRLALVHRIGPGAGEVDIEFYWPGHAVERQIAVDLGRDAARADTDRARNEPGRLGFGAEEIGVRAAYDRASPR